MEIKEIIVPENWEVFIEDGIATFRKKQTPPRSWEEFCKTNPIKHGEAYIGINSDVHIANLSIESERDPNTNKSWCISKEEAEAFLALMQLRQLRKVWVDGWKQPNSEQLTAVICYNRDKEKVEVNSGHFWSGMNLSFPRVKMAQEFFDCFKDLCETAKILL